MKFRGRRRDETRQAEFGGRRAGETTKFGARGKVWEGCCPSGVSCPPSRAFLLFAIICGACLLEGAAGDRRDYSCKEANGGRLAANKQTSNLTSKQVSKQTSKQTKYLTSNQANK